jgi:hypothetical protein
MAMSDYEQCHVAEEIRQKECLPVCKQFKEELDACAKRIENHPDPNAHCEYQFYDFWRCMDKCVCFPVFVGCFFVPSPW